MKGTYRWITFGIWLVGTLVVLYLAHDFEVGSVESDPDANQRFKGYGVLIAGSYNILRVGALTIMGSVVIYMVVSFIVRQIARLAGKGPG